MSKLHGYVYRRFPLTQAELRKLIAQHVYGVSPVFACAGSMAQLESMRQYASAEQVLLEGDFGHVFSAKAEARWKKGQAGYDVLVLTEHPIPEWAGTELPTAGSLTVRHPPPSVSLVLDIPGETQDGKRQSRLEYVEYLGLNRTVQFVRYTKLH
jgi:hypothetical protein